MAISINNLFFHYEKRFPIIEGGSLEIPLGAFVGIFGPNGGGKTTLLNLILGFLTPTKGSIKVLGKDPVDVRTKIGYVPQVRRFDKQFPITVLEVVLQGCLASHRGWGNFTKEAKERAYEALAKVHLKDKADAPFGTLSGGQIQRTLIARALATDPEILLLDEATVGIDPKTLHDIFKFLVELKRKMTIVLVTHDLQAIAGEMDQLFCINRQIIPFSQSELCGHFAMGLYHPQNKRDK